MKTMEPLIFEKSVPGRKAYSLPSLDVPEKPLEKLIPPSELRKTPAVLPETSEIDLVRHFTRLSQLNHGVDIGFYPLGSCTMKYNPKINEEVASLPGFTGIHPYAPEHLVQGALELMYTLQKDLEEIGGMDEISLQPAAGAHGELAGIYIIKAYHKASDENEPKFLFPTSPWNQSCLRALAGFHTDSIDDRGGVDARL